MVFVELAHAAGVDLSVDESQRQQREAVSQLVVSSALSMFFMLNAEESTKKLSDTSRVHFFVLSSALSGIFFMLSAEDSTKKGERWLTRSTFFVLSSALSMKNMLNAEETTS